jgi:hypothetical protein
MCKVYTDQGHADLHKIKYRNCTAEGNTPDNRSRRDKKEMKPRNIGLLYKTDVPR